MLISVTVSTVTTCPIGANPSPSSENPGHISVCTVSINVLVALSKLLSKIVSLTVPPPFQIGVTLTAPTPSMSFVLFL